MAHQSFAGPTLRPFAYPFVELHITSLSFRNHSFFTEEQHEGRTWRLPRIRLVADGIPQESQDVAITWELWVIQQTFSFGVH